MSADLEGEFSAACCNIDGPCLAELQAVGIRTHRSDGAQLVGSMPIETHRGGLFEPRDTGRLAMLVPCGWWDGLTWQLSDVVAFRLGRPERWWRRLGAADGLGDLHGFTVEPKRLHPTPLAWLKGSGRGLCLLDWRVDPVDLLVGAGPLAAEQSLKNKMHVAAARAAARNIRTLFND